uniref:uncharacterized protein LOC113474869 n=1 Tax=Ciona intestinalis TaxID=7719 RepID=UPI000EF46C84|nr:uncharacterized protein LOC113474869 [Ciona intestinalis]|eukprot:XP_026693436.1 uncharacterized protein LOC113474869 [Ciona intestinalis]
MNRHAPPQPPPPQAAALQPPPPQTTAPQPPPLQTTAPQPPPPQTTVPQPPPPVTGERVPTTTSTTAAPTLPAGAPDGQTTFNPTDLIFGDEPIVEDGCPVLQLRNGELGCTSGNATGSSCMFECFEDEGYVPYPSTSFETRCDGTEWSKPLPCCARIHLPNSAIHITKQLISGTCPPYARTDVIILLGITSPTNWRSVSEFVQAITSSFTISNEQVNFGIVRYHSSVDTASQILLRYYPNHPDQILFAIARIPFGNGGSRAGKAMGYTSNAMLVEANGNRPDAPNIVLLITDTMSQDSFTSEAARLRSQTEKVCYIVCIL